MSNTPIQSAGRVGTQSAGRVLQCSNFIIQYGWFYRDGNGINSTDQFTTPASGVVLDGPGYFDGTWANFNIPNAIQGTAPNIWIIPNLTGIPKPGAAPGKVDPDTGLPYVLTSPGPKICTFGADWNYVSVADFSASVGLDLASQGFTGMFAVVQFSKPNRGLTVRFQNLISTGIYSVFGFGIPAGNQMSWTYAFFINFPGSPNAEAVQVVSTGTQTGQGGIREVLIGANSGKIFDLVNALPILDANGNINSRTALDSSEPFYPAVVYDVVNPVIPPFPNLPSGATGFGKILLQGFQQSGAMDGTFVSL